MKGQGLVLLDYASTIEKRTKHERRGRPEGAEISKRLILRAFLLRSEELLSEFRRKWGFPVPPQLWNEPELLKDDLVWRDPSLTRREIVRTIQLSDRRVKALLPELVTDGLILPPTLRGREKVYRPKDLEECQKPLIVYGSRKKKHVERLRDLGLDVIWVKLSPGRPKRSFRIRDDKTLNRDKGVHLVAELMTLLQKDNLPIVEGIAQSTHMKFKRHDGLACFAWTTKDGQMDRIRKAISQHKKDQKQRRRKEKSRLGSQQLAPAEKDRIMRSARLR